MSRVKVVATIGPKTDNSQSLLALRQAGMDVARLNGAHADLGWHKRVIELLRRVDSNVPVLLDIPGSKIRTAGVVREFDIAAGEIVVLSPHQGKPAGSNARQQVALNYPAFHEDVQLGDTLVLDDGSLSLVVDDIVSQEVVCRAIHAGKIRNGQGLHLPSATSLRPFLSERDLELLGLAVSEGVDFVGISFVETAAHVEAVRELVGRQGPAIVSKIETKQALADLSELIEQSDVLMIDRGDLSVATRLETIGLLQKHVLAEATRSARPVIVGTQILHSMINNPSPTKAEVSDITNSVLDGASALMLSGETAIGDFPVEAVACMRDVADAVAASLDEQAGPGGGPREDSVPQAMGEAIASLCCHLEVTKIVAITISGYAARMVAAKMPSQPMLAVSNDPGAARRFNLLRGTKGVHVDIPFPRTSLEHIPRCLEELWRRGEIVDDDLVLVTAVGYPKSGNRMNLIETHKVADLRDNLGWTRSPAAGGTRQESTPRAT